MLRFILIVCLMAFVMTMPVFAESEGEFGALAGLSIFANDDNDDEISTVIVPQTLYLMLFDEEMGFGPEITLTHTDGSVEIRSIGCRGSLFFNSSSISGGYALAQGQLVSIMDQYDSNIHLGLGLGFGYQWRVGSVCVFRTEGRFRRVFLGDDDAFNEISLTFGLGARLGE